MNDPPGVFNTETYSLVTLCHRMCLADDKPRIYPALLFLTEMCEYDIEGNESFLRLLKVNEMGRFSSKMGVELVGLHTIIFC